MADRVLFVDDEPLVLESLRRALRGRYDIATATSGATGLELIGESLTQGDPFAVIVSDMMMPVMSGVEFLARAADLTPDSIAMILSGQADLEQTIKVVNSANLFRFLTKPLAPDALCRALDHALRQHQLIHAERQLLERTVGGAANILTDVLSMASPAASRRTAQLRSMVACVADQLGLAADWRLPVAAMLSHIGCVAVPGHVLEKLEAGQDLDAQERAIFDSHPAQGQRLLAQIPRFEQIAEWVGRLPTSTGQYAPEPGRPADASATDDEAPFVLEAVGGFLLSYCAGGTTAADVLQELASTGRYSDDLLDAVRGAAATLAPRGVKREVTVRQLLVGMIFERDVRTCSGQILIRKGEHVTAPLATRLTNFDNTVGVVQPLLVLDVQGVPAGS